MSIGKVSIIGAGPGDPELISVKGAKRLKEADIIFYDALIPDEFFEYFGVDAELIFVGKRSGFHSHSQEEINQLLIENARKGKYVVRLKGGDPFIYGRGGEEALALKKSDLPFELIPGISAVNSVGTLAGIPVTHRGVSNRFLVLEGQSDINKEEWKKYATFTGTILVFMASRSAHRIAKKLLDNGAEPFSRIAIIENASLANQKIQRTSLGKVARREVKAETNGPGLLIIGDVVDIDCLGQVHLIKDLYGAAS